MWKTRWWKLWIALRLGGGALGDGVVHMKIGGEVASATCRGAAHVAELVNDMSHYNIFITEVLFNINPISSPNLCGRHSVESCALMGVRSAMAWYMKNSGEITSATCAWLPSWRMR